MRKLKPKPKVGCRWSRWGTHWQQVCHYSDGNKTLWDVKARRDNDDEPIARLIVTRRESPARLVISLIEVSLDHQRGRWGTKLYEKAAKLACDEGRTLESDDTRSRFAEAFWRKQDAKGRVACLQVDHHAYDDKPGGKVYNAPLWELEERLQDPEAYEAIVAKLPTPVKNAEGETIWPCARWVVQSPCATRSLARLPARRKRKR